MIQEIFKGKGDPGIPSQYRDVLLADDDGKAMFSVIRKAVFPLAASFVNSTQYGSGFSGGGSVLLHIFRCNYLLIMLGSLGPPPPFFSLI